MKIVDGKAVAETSEEEAALKTLLETETAGLKAKRDELLGKLKGFDHLKDIDPDEYKRLKTEAEKNEQDKMYKAGEFENLKKQLLDAHAKEKSDFENKIKVMQKSLEENVLIASATAAIAQEKGVPILLMPHVRSRTKLDDDGNPIVLDDHGNKRVNAKGEPFTIAELIKEMKSNTDTFGRAFEASNQSGSGATNNNHNGNGIDYSKMNPVERITAARQAGLKT